MLKDFFNYIYEIRGIVGGFISNHLFVIEIVSFTISLLLLWGIFYSLIKINYWGMKVDKFVDILGVGRLSKRRLIKGWKQVKKRMKLPDVQQWKLAVMEADTILNEALKKFGYLSRRLADKLDVLTAAQISNTEELKWANKIRRKIYSEPDFSLTREEAVKIIDIYKKSLIELNLIKE